MATLTPTQLAQLRREFVRKLGNVEIDFDKPILNAACQAIEDWYETNKAQISTDIDAATAPYVFTGQQKKLIGAFWLLQKSGREL